MKNLALSIIPLIGTFITAIAIFIHFGARKTGRKQYETDSFKVALLTLMIVLLVAICDILFLVINIKFFWILTVILLFLGLIGLGISAVIIFIGVMNKGRSNPKPKELVAFSIFLKILAWCVLSVAIILSIFYTATSIFLMVIFVMSVVIIFAILYALAVIVGMFEDLNR